MVRNLNKFGTTSTTRLPLDHAISGALLAGITTVAYDLRSGEKCPYLIAKNALRNGLAGGLAAASAINAANSLVQRKYFEATLSVAVGIVGVLLIEQEKK